MGSIHYAVPWYFPYHSNISHSYFVVSVHTAQDGPAPTPHLLHLIPRQPLVSQLGRDGCPTRVVNDSSQAVGQSAIVH